jgi:DNA polymerase-1
MMIGQRSFSEVVLADFEFFAPPGERPSPICLVARELVSGRVHRIFQDVLSDMTHPPYPVGPDCLFVAYYASAEVGCHLELGWPAPHNIIDLFPEFRNATNGRSVPRGNGILGALVYYGLEVMNVSEKKEMRELAMRGGPYTSEERLGLIAYCEEDVNSLQRLWSVMLPTLDVERALLRGRYMGAAGRIEHEGVPIDMDSLTTLRTLWPDIQGALIEEIDADYGVFCGRSFRAELWEQWVRRRQLPWPQLPSGRLCLDDNTFKEMATLYPDVAPIRSLRKDLADLRLSNVSVGKDGRNRYMLSAFASKTGRNQPSTSKSIFGLSKWFRGLIQPEPGYSMAYIDWGQQEVGIAAALSEDAAMIEAYRTGDPYRAGAIKAGLMSSSDDLANQARIRSLFKTCVLGTLYSMGPWTLAQRTGLDLPYAADLLSKHRQTYPKFWEWSDRAVDAALLHNQMHTTFGWNLFIEGHVNPNSLRNFPMQANGAEMLRLAIVLAVDRGVRVVAPVHDALLIEARTGDFVEAVLTTRRAMAEASRIVLCNLELRTDIKTIWHPQRYYDKDGDAMWNKVWKIVNRLKAQR